MLDQHTINEAIDAVSIARIWLDGLDEITIALNESPVELTNAMATVNEMIVVIKRKLTSSLELLAPEKDWDYMP